MDIELQDELASAKEEQRKIDLRAQLKERLQVNYSKRLGQGQYPVYEATWLGRGGQESVAAKRLPLDDGISREIKALQRAEHKNIVKYLDLLKDGEHQYVVMELCDGDLWNMIQDFANQGTHVCHQLVEAIACMHSDEVNLAHRCRFCFKLHFY